MSSRAARAPGKLILAGEHAVVHGAPALAVAVSLYARVEAEPLADPVLEWTLPGRPPERTPLEELAPHAASVDARHRAFVQGELDAAAVAPRPLDLLNAAAARTRPEHGWRLRFTSDIPPGAGMGSSAAFLLALFHVLRPEWDADTLYRHALACEHYQHGRSSGLDVAVSLRGGAIWSQTREHAPLDLPALPPFQVLVSGQPSSTTGECVEAVTARFPDDHPVWHSFHALAHRTRDALLTRDAEAWDRAIRDNHRLLVDIGVVPNPVRAAIADLERRGGAVKVCGAGCVRGPAAGALLARGVPDKALPSTWSALSPTLDTRGVTAG